MKALLSSTALVFMMLLSLTAHSRLGANGANLNGVSLNGVSLNGIIANGTSFNGVRLQGVHPTVNLRGLAQAPLVKAN